MFVFKKIACSLLTPPGAVMVLFALGLVRLAFGRGKVLLLLAAALLYVLSTAPVVDLMVRPLESRFQPVADPRSTEATSIVVLAGGGYELTGTPAHATLGSHSMARLAEGVRLWRLLEGRARLILSGGSASGATPVAKLMGQAARECLGVDPRSITVEAESRDTGESARLVAPLVRGERFILVTSAIHMPRSMADFEAQGLKPIPAPTDYLSRTDGSYALYRFLPSGSTLHASAMASHEWLGLAWQRAARMVPGKLRTKGEPLPPEVPLPQ